MNENPTPQTPGSPGPGLDPDATIFVTPPVPRSNSVEQAGEFIGPYQLIEPLGEGGFGTVWRAEQKEPIHREVALKVIKLGMDSREIIARFEAERQALALMDHPNIAAVLDAGTTKHGRPFFAMELVKGVPITDYCDANKLSIRKRLELFIPVCQAVQHAHQKSILHRDLKPTNILVMEVDGKPVPKVIDFGIAKALHATAEPALHATLAQTLDGLIVGTPQYMSPEQAGSVPDVDTRSDIYTLGVILYELLVGDTPLSREQMKKAALDDMLRLIRESEPQRPSSRFTPATELAKTTASQRHTEPKKLGHALRGDLDWIVLKALEKDRARRYDTANAFAQDLQRHLNDEPVSAGPPSAGYRLRKLVRRNKLAFGAAAIVAVSLISGVAISTWQAVRATRAESLTDKERDKQDRLLLSASYGDHEAALRAAGKHNYSESLAYFERALSFAPKNSVTLAASASYAFGSSAPAWHTRSVSAFDDAVTCLAFSPDGRQLAVGSGDNETKGRVRMIEVATGMEVIKVEFKIEFGEHVTSVSFSPDGRYLAVGNKGFVQTDRMRIAKGSVRVIEVATGKQAGIFESKFGGVNSVSFSPDGRHIAVGLLGNTALVIEAVTGKEVSRAESKFYESVTSVSFSPDGRHFAAGSQNGARVIETATGKEVRMKLFNTYLSSLSFSPDGRYLGIGIRDKTAQVIEAATGVQVMKANTDTVVTSVSFSPDGRHIAAGCEDHTVRIIDVTTGKEVSKFETGSSVTAVSFSPDGRHLAAGCRDKTVRMAEAAMGKQVSKAVFGSNVNSVSFSPDGRHLAVGSGTYHVVDINNRPLTRFSRTGEARVIDVATGSEVMKVGVGTYVTAVSYSPDGRYLATGNDVDTACVLEAATGKEVSRVKFGGRVTSVRFSPDGRHLAVGSTDRTARVIEATTGKEVKKVEFDFAILANSVSFSPDGRLLAVGCERDGKSEVRVIEVSTGKEVRTVEVENFVRSVSFSPDGRHVAVGGDRAQVIEIATGRVVSLAGTGWGEAHFSPDGRHLSVGEQVIDVATGKEISKAGAGQSLSYSPDGRYLALGYRAIHVGIALVVDAEWLKTDIEVAGVWAAALRVQAGLSFQQTGRLEAITASDLLAAQQKVRAYIAASASPNERWTHAILKWSQMPPEERTTSPWTTEPLRVAAGRWLMQASGQPDFIPASAATTTDAKKNTFITETADGAPWHPLEPVSLARLEPKSDDKTKAAAREAMLIRPRFLARLTLKRLIEANEKLYGRDTLAEYAAWSAKIMHEELNNDPEALEAIAFALERTPVEKQQALLDLKAKIEVKGGNPVADGPQKPTQPRINGTDALTLVDLAKNSQVDAVWSRTASGIEWRANGRPAPYAGTFLLPVDLAPSFAVEVEFTCGASGESVGITIPVGDNRATTCWFASNGYAGIGKIDGEDPRPSSIRGTASRFILEPGQLYKARAEVRRAPEGVDIQFLVDGKTVAAYRGSTSRLNYSTMWRIGADRSHFFLGASNKATFHRATMKALEDLAAGDKSTPPTPVPAVPLPVKP